MILMTGYEMPLRAIREQIASAVDLIVHTARLKDGSRKIVNITEVYGIEDDEILTQDIFAFEQTGFRDGKIVGALQPTGIRPTFMAPVQGQRRRAAAGRVRDPARGPGQPGRPRKGGWGAATSPQVDRLGRPSRPGRAVVGRRDGLRLLGRAGRSGHRRDRQRLDQGPDAPVPDQPQGQARSAGQLARQGRLGQLVAARPDRVRHVQRGMAALVPGRRAGRPGHAHAAAPAPGRVPGLDRGHRRAWTATCHQRRMPCRCARRLGLARRRSAGAGQRLQQRVQLRRHAPTPRRSHPPPARRGDRSCRPRRR